MDEYTVRELLEDTDPFGYIAQGSLADIYDRVGNIISNKLSPDLSVDQISKIIWDSFYSDLCLYPEIDLILTKPEGKYILGEPERFTELAQKIRKELKF